MTLQHLRYVLAVAEFGTMNRASERLNVAQPSLSTAIRSLEEELGIKIFKRTARGVTLTENGEEFMVYARQLYNEYLGIMDKYGKGDGVRKRFAVSTQHYSFAVKSFVEMVKRYNTQEYDFAIRETMTREVLDDVAKLKSQIGLIYLSDFNQVAIQKMLRVRDLIFYPLCRCHTYVYLYKGHPLHDKKSLTLKDLAPYPNLSFEQGDGSTLFLSEEIFSTNEYTRQIKVTDRGTMCNLFIGLNGYTLCSGIFCEELNGSDYFAVPFKNEDKHKSDVMEIGFVLKKNLNPSKLTLEYIELMRSYLSSDPHAELCDESTEPFKKAKRGRKSQEVEEGLDQLDEED